MNLGLASVLTVGTDGARLLKLTRECPVYIGLWRSFSGASEAVVVFFNFLIIAE